MNAPRIIGFTGYAQSGKSTLAAHVTERYGHRELSFADGVRAVAERIDPVIDWRSAIWTYTQLLGQYGYENAKGVPGFRDALVNVGAGLREIIGPNVWVDRVMRIIDNEPDRTYVIPDVRYLNEAKAIRARGGVVIYVDRQMLDPANEEERRSILELRQADMVDRMLFNGPELRHTVALLERQLDTLS